MTSTYNLTMLEQIIDYQFSIQRHGEQALVAAHRDQHDPRNSSDGNRKLAQAGGILLQMVLQLFWMNDNISRGEAQEKLNLFSSDKILADVANSSGIWECITRSPRQTAELLSKRVLANATKAVLYAVWIDSHEDIHTLRRVIRKIFRYDDQASRAFSADGFVDGLPQQYVDSTMLTLIEPQSIVSMNAREASYAECISSPIEDLSSRARNKSRSSASLLTRLSPSNQYMIIEAQKSAGNENTQRDQRFYLEVVNHSIAVNKLKRCAEEARIFSLVMVSCASVIALRDAIAGYRYTESGNHISYTTALSAPERYEVIQSIGDKLHFLVLVKRYHILKLYTECLSDYSLEVHDGFINFGSSSSPQGPGISGNPILRAQGEVNDEMLRRIYPNLDRADESRRKQLRREITRIKVLGKRLYWLTKSTGLGLLPLLPSNVESGCLHEDMAISDARIRNLSEDDASKIGHVIGAVSTMNQSFLYATTKIMKSMFEGQAPLPRHLFEFADNEEILSKAGGSEDLASTLRVVEE